MESFFKITFDLVPRREYNVVFSVVVYICENTLYHVWKARCCFVSLSFIHFQCDSAKFIGDSLEHEEARENWRSALHSGTS